MYYHGYGVEQDYIQVVYWYTESTKQENADAQYLLGEIYYYGDEIPQDTEQAIYWLTQFAEQQQVDAQILLGIMYADGDGVEQEVQMLHSIIKYLTEFPKK